MAGTRTKYVDAEKIIAKIERYENTAIEAYNPLEDDADFWHGKVVACEDLKTFVTSLWQEQSHFADVGKMEQPEVYNHAMLEIKAYVDKLYDDAGIGLNEYDMGLYNGIIETCMKLRGFIKARIYGEQPEDIVVIAKTFLDALSKTPYNNKPITDAQIIVKQLLLFFENPKEYNPDAILEQPEGGCSEKPNDLLSEPEVDLEK